MPWHRAAARSDLDGRGVLGTSCGGRRVALYALDDGVYATSDTCPHMGASLAEGCVVQGWIECPAHRALFDIRTGAADGAVTATGLRTFPVKVEGGAVFVDVPSVEESAG